MGKEGDICGDFNLGAWFLSIKGVDFGQYILFINGLRTSIQAFI